MIRLKAFLSSLFIHVFFLLLFVVLLKFNIESSARYVEIDLSLANFVTTTKEASLKGSLKPETKKKKVSKPKVSNIQPAKEDVYEVSKEKDVKEVPLKEKIAEKEEKKADKDVSNIGTSAFGMIRGEAFGKKEKEGIGDGLISEGSGGNDNALDAEKIKEKFLFEKLYIISKIVQKNINYPYVARKMGWEGRVIVSFILTKEGKINSLTIEKSSGYEILDENAIKTVKRVSGYFPIPPLDVKIKLPISYKLE